MADEKESKTEDPTSKKLKDARKKGRVPRSQEINSALILFVGITLLSIMGNWMLEALQRIMREFFVASSNLELSQTNFQAIFWLLSQETLIILAPLMLTIMVVGISATVFQGGFVFSTEPLKIDFGRLNPVNGFKRLFALRSLMTLGMSLLKIIPISFMVYQIIRDEMPMLMHLSEIGIMDIILNIGLVAKRISYRICLFLIVLAVADYFYQKWQFKKDMKMSKQEIKDEIKNTEGNPLIKRHIRKMQYEVAMRRMMEKVPQADVVITNPIHLAVVLQYEVGSDAPVVVAKGARLIAERIKELAQLNGVPIVENKPLARALFSAVEVGQAVPEYLFTAVAEVLAYVYRLKNRQVAS